MMRMSYIKHGEQCWECGRCKKEKRFRNKEHGTYVTIGNDGVAIICGDCLEDVRNAIEIAIETKPAKEAVKPKLSVNTKAPNGN